MGIDLDAPFAGAIDLGTPTAGDSGTTETPQAIADRVLNAPVAAVATVEDGKAVDASFGETTKEPEKTPEAKAKDEADAKAKADSEAKAIEEAKEAAAKAAEEKALRESDRVIELSRSKREAERRAAKASKEAEVHAASVKKLEPVVELFKLAESDPLAFVAEIADVAGLSPERVLQIIQTRGAGGDPPALSVDEKLALLERKLEEAKADRDRPKPTEPQRDPEVDAKAEQARDGLIDRFQTILEGAPQAYPHSAQDTAVSSEAAFLILANHWTTNGRQADGSTRPDYKPPTFAQALAAVERTLSKRVTPVAGSIPAPAKPVTDSRSTPAPGVSGLSNRSMGAVLPEDSDRILSDEEIRLDMLRRYSPSAR